ncbi:MAG: metalloprotease PmbA [Burkholderiaceae bacterium]|nr:metalloprotease PmbA [Burkholderiaceae bacterium]
MKKTAQTATPKRADANVLLADFQFSQSHFQALVHDALQCAKGLGAADAVAEVSEAYGLSVSVRNRELENVERNRDKSLGVTLYLGHHRGHAATSDFSKAAIAQTVKAAYDIARFTAEDAMAGLPDVQDVVTEVRDLDLFHPWAIDAAGAADIAKQCEGAALKTSKLITNSEGASVSAQHSHFYAAHMRQGQMGGAGVFAGGYASTRHSIGTSVIAGKGDGMQRDAWFSSMRDHTELASPKTIGRYAAERTLSRLNARKIPTTQCPVLFEAPLASGLLGSFVHAISGGALYRNSSFLMDSLGKQVFAKHIDVFEDPFVLKGKGSSPFDDEGVSVQARDVVSAGVVQGYFLGSYSARKLGMRTTGHAGGSHNLFMRSRKTAPTDDLDAMLKKLGRGLFVTDLMGQGVNGVTGDYSRGASGFWVDKGEIQFPVEEITIAGNLRDMFMGIKAIGCDTYNHGAKTVGSVLIDRMKVAGA